MNLIPNTKYTIIDLSHFSGATRKREIRIGEATGSMITYYRKGSRVKAYYLNLSDGELIFAGWGLPLNVDSITVQLRGERRYLFLSDHPARLKEFISRNNVNEYFSRWGAIMVSPADQQQIAKPLFLSI